MSIATFLFRWRLNTRHRQDEAVSQQKLIPYQEFIAARKPIHSHHWTDKPWWLFSWGLKQLGLLDSFTGAGLLPTASFVLLPIVEVCGSCSDYGSFVHLRYRKPRVRSSTRWVMEAIRSIAYIQCLCSVLKLAKFSNRLTG